MIRLFVAIPLPEAIRTQLSLLQSGLPGARWIKPENIHLTLRFIGEVRNDIATDIDTALAQISAPGFDLELDGIGNFARGKHPHALWAGVAKSEPLMRLQAKIEAGLVRAGLAPETRKFSPHITIARLKDTRRGRVEDWATVHGGFRSPPFRVDRFALFSSFLKSEGAVYVEEASYELTPGVLEEPL
ncbi:MAG: RNA 2',3'-cyclic phosphodiesterase [Rhodospirillales bacterium]|nr:MAG: RNA 2',3'-cyclic phosphodiesterase [Rhodospirillales bacterium]